MTFGDAIEALKSGHDVSRFGWNKGPGVWLSLCQASFPMTSPYILVSMANDPALRPASDLAPFVEEVPLLPDTAAWVPTHADLLAGDWVIKGE